MVICQARKRFYLNELVKIYDLSLKSDFQNSLIYAVFYKN
jgi:hypothetical protein